MKIMLEMFVWVPLPCFREPPPDVGLPASVVLFSVSTFPNCVKRKGYCHFGCAAVRCFYM